MKKRKIIIPIVCLAAASAGIVSWRSRSANGVAVIAVSDLSSGGMMDDAVSSTGTVYQASSQSVYPSSSDIIKEVYVKQGDQVKAGDPLLAYDVTSLQLSYAKKQLAVEQAENTLNADRSRLTKLQHTAPSVIPTAEPETAPTPAPSVTPAISKTKTDDAWNAVDADSLSSDHPQYVTDETGQYGTKDHPYVFVVTEDAVVYGSFFNALQGSDSYVSFRIYENNIVNPDELVSEWNIRCSLLMDCDDSDAWSILTHHAVSADPQTEEAPVETIEKTESDNGSSYTAAELAQAIKEQQHTVRNDEIALRKAQLELQVQKDSLNDGIVRARTDGTVTKVSDPENRPKDGTAFLTVASSGGTTIRTYVSELMLDQVQQGTELNVTDYNDGSSYTATVTSVDDTPASDVDQYNDGNPNVSWYPVYAEINEQNSLSASSLLGVSPLHTDTGSDIVISNAFVRYGNGRYYVMKDDHGKLKKQNVEVGSIYWGSEYEITSGLSQDDAIAFPYGRRTKEGAKTKKGSMEDFYG